ncbi:CGNR zinc finger domain-containing protein [Helcococcus massiliensis]|uniref:CGNR zinc finger domain-containing protein n=1 Tax=Helcococcus massiliensis TaxID=2040290 RepID=UPI000CDEC6B7|nr:CGNR zinc finger domain-containing protein [Helcococcus massiliensis]
MEREFLTQFTFENNSCACDIESVIDDMSGNLIKRIALKETKDQTIKMGYIYGSGLKVLGDRKKREKNNVLGEFLGIKKDDIESYKSYFEKYGFLFNTNPDRYTSINTSDLYYLQESLLAFVQLMNNQYDIDFKNSINTQELLDACIFLLFREPKTIKINDSIVFETKQNYIMNIVNNSINHNDGIEGLKYEDRNGQKIGYFEIYDSVFETTIKIDQEKYLKILQHERLPNWCKKLLRVYKNKNQLVKNHKWHKVSDFLYHLVFDLSPFDMYNITLDGIFNDELYKDLKQNKQIFDALIYTSKLLLSEEFQNNLKSVHPVYNVLDMKPDWKLPSLFSAMYFSLFYLDSSQVGLRKCANPTCNQYFEVSKTNSKKKYCDSFTCGNIVNQRRYQRKKREQQK